MPPVSGFELLLLLIAVTLILELLARRLNMPPAAALILGGMGLTLVPGMPELHLDPDVVLVLFLPPLLFESAIFTVWRDFRADLRIILQLAIGAVAFTTAVVGIVAHWMLPGLPWAACFALGAIVSPPDAVAAKAVLQRVKLPARVTVLLEGESLVNDASGLVLYRFAVTAALTGAFSAGQAALSFVSLSVGGIAVGIAFGYGVSFLLARLRDPGLSTIGTLLAAWTSYIGADALGVSGVLSTVTCGLILGWRQHSVISAETRTHARAVWNVLVFVLESLVFILIGLSLRGVLHRLDSDWHAAVVLGPGVAAIVAVVVVSRFAWIIPASYLSNMFASRAHRDDPMPLSVPVVMSWAGMRGVVSLAAALALPDGFPGRDFILVATFVVILVTVLLQGSTLAPLIRVLHLPVDGARHTLSEEEARIHMVQAQLAAVERASRTADGTDRHPRLVEQYGYRAQAAARYHEAAGALAGPRAEHFDAVLTALAAGRAEILRLHRAGTIHDSVLWALEQELDLEEISARRSRSHV